MIKNIYNIPKKNGNQTHSPITEVDVAINNCIEEICSKQDKKLINLVFKENISQKELDVFFTDWDIEVEGGNKALMIAYLMKMRPDLKFPEYTGPRLKGLLNYYKFRNVKLISHFVKICAKLNKEKIKILIIKGGAMKHLRPEYPRIMGDIDIIVPKNDYIKACEIAEGMGYDCAYSSHSVDLHLKGSEEGILDIHKFINMGTGHETSINEDLFKRAKPTRIFGAKVYIPSNEDLFFISLVNMARNINNKTSIDGILYSLFDTKYLSENDFNWNIVIDNAKKTKTEIQIAFIIKFINKLIPNFLPEKIKNTKLFKKKLNDYCILLVYRKFFLWGMKQRGHVLRFWTIFSSFDRFVEYLKMKPKYLLLKSLRFSPKIAKFIMQIDKRYHIVEKKYVPKQFYK